MNVKSFDKTAIRSITERDQWMQDRLRVLQASLGPGPIALYGAGSHTRHMLRRFADLLPQIAFILDDCSEMWDQTIDGVRICNPTEAAPSDVTAVLISSDAAEESLTAQAIAWINRAGDASPRPPIVKIYENCKLDYLRRSPLTHQHHQPRNGSNATRAFHGAHRLVPEFNSLYDRGLAAAGVRDNEHRRARFYNLVNLLRLTSGLPGHTAEAGCYRGQSSYLICRTRATEDSSFDGSTHIIVDSFEGLSQPTTPDGAMSVQRYNNGIFADTSIEHVQTALADFPAVRIFKGWIPQVFHELDDVSYRFVHVDVDLHEPVLNSLEYFYPRLVPGGLIVVDDHGPVPDGTYPGCAQACREFSERIGIPFAPLNAGNAIFVKRIATTM